MNHVVKYYFRLFETEGFSVNYICSNIKSRLNLLQLANYFQTFGFNHYQKVRQENKSRKDINNKDKLTLCY